MDEKQYKMRGKGGERREDKRDRQEMGRERKMKVKKEEGRKQ